MKVFIDFDDVIFNTGKFKADLKALFLAEGISEEMFDKHYYDPNDTRKLKLFDPILHAFRIETETGISTQALMIKIGIFLKNVSGYVFDDVIPFFKEIGRENIYLISFGEENFVKMKVSGSGLLRYINAVRVVSGRKSDAIREILSSDGAGEGEKVFFLDDRSEQIAEVKKEIPDAITLLVKRPEGRYCDPKEKCCDHEVENLKEAGIIIDSFKLKS